MLDPELDLEADLGIDTVKQAEVFATVRESFGIERDPNLQLRDFNTLNRVVGFVYDRRPDAGGVAGAGAPAAGTTAPAAGPDTVSLLEGSLEAAAAIPRRVPTPVLRPSVEQCKATGVSLGSGSRVAVMPDQGGCADALISALESRGVDVLRLDPDGSDDAFDDIGPVQGVFWLAGLDDEGSFTELEVEAFQAAVKTRVKRLFRTVKGIYAELDDPSRFVVTATRLGGTFGAVGSAAVAPLGGGICGLTKTVARERPQALVKVVDFEADAAPAAVAEALVQEAEIDPAAVEIGRQGNDRITLSLVEIPVEDGRPGLSFGPESVFVVSGAAGSITSAIVADLASAAPGATFHLMDLAPAPDENDPALAAFARDPSGLKKELFQRIQASGEKATPVKVERIMAGLERKASALAAIEAVRRHGGKPVYHSVDLRDDARVVQVMQEAGPVDVLVHAGGLEISRLMPDKSFDEFDLVFDVKAQGWLSLLRGCGDTLPKATVVFSSIAGRFGNGGQADYASANDLLAKTSSALRAHGVRALVLDWTAWGGIGMATRGSIPKMMEMAGIDMLPPDAGVAYVRRELISGGRADEVVVALALGILTEERDEHGGLSAEAMQPTGPMGHRLRGAFVTDGWVMEATLDPTEQPFLDHHRIGDTPVLPGVMGLESFAEIAHVVQPDLHVVGLENVSFEAPFKFYRDEPRTVEVEAHFVRAEGDEVLAHCRLVGRRQLAHQSKPETTVHFRGTVRLSPRPLDPFVRSVPEGGPSVSKEAIYRVYFHGPAYQVLNQVRRAGDDAVGDMATDLPPNHLPADRPMVLDPRWIEACFQTAGVQSIGRTSVMALPSGIRRLWWHGDAEPQSSTKVVVMPGEDGTVDADVIDATGRVLLHIEGYRTADLPGNVPDDLADPFVSAFR
jgi:acyl carrier protein